MANKRIIAFRDLDLSDNFFDLVEAVLQETIKQENNSMGVFSPQADLSEIQKQYREITKWSDSRIIIPVLFNFFHGIELFLKGCKYLIKEPNGKLTHNLSILYFEFTNNYSDRATLIRVLDYYIFPNENLDILRDFYMSNNLANSSEFYEVFRYPYNQKFTTGLAYKDLRNKEGQGLKFFKQVIDDIAILRTEKKLL